MKDRLEQFLTAEGISRAAFADSISVARAAISHIMAGRNNPGYDFIINTMKAYPTLNIEWLLNGTGTMYKNGSTVPSVNNKPKVEREDLFSTQAASFREEPESKSEVKLENESKVKLQADVLHKVKRVTIFYDDGTFEELSGN